MQINRKLLYELYIKEVDEICEVCDWKTCFEPEEIVDIIATILEKNKDYLINEEQKNTL